MKIYGPEGKEYIGDAVDCREIIAQSQGTWTATAPGEEKSAEQVSQDEKDRVAREMKVAATGAPEGASPKIGGAKKGK